MTVKTKERYISWEIVRRLIGYDGPCCESCHEDNELFGIEMTIIEFGRGRWTEVCCFVSNAYDDWRVSRPT